MIDKAFIEQKLKELIRQKEKAFLQQHVLDGAIQLCEMFLKECEIQQTPVSDDPTPLHDEVVVVKAS